MTPKRNNLISDLYIQQIKQFKPTPLSASLADIKAFLLPAKPVLPSDDIAADAVAAYDAAPVDTESAPAAGAAPVEEDWFVFEDEEEHH